jgi:hypothetical protein
MRGAPHPIPPPQRGREAILATACAKARPLEKETATEKVTVQWTVTRALARRREPEGKWGAAWTVGLEIGPRLPGLAR